MSKSTTLGANDLKPCFSKYSDISLLYILFGGLFLCQSFLDGFAFCFVAGLVEQGKHVFLVSLYARLVERVYTENVAADATCYLEEIDELSDVILVELGNADADVGHTAVYMRQPCAQFGHFVHFVYALSGKKVQPIGVFIVLGNNILLLGCSTLSTVS